MGVGKSYKLASKYEGDYGRMVLQLPNGDFTIVLEARFPSDGQLHDNFEFMREAEKLYHKRMRKSI